jgi:DNA-binding LacI/PurR family transcriptional regulator/DNA-binding transcriptional regulator YhcF (GntR family)
MKNRIAKPALQSALNFIKNNLEKGTWLQGEQLPPIRILAKMASVSVRTMVRAAAILKSTGAISGVERSRLIAGNRVKGASLHVDHPGQIWLKKRSLIEQDILSGKYAELGRLPSTKELQAHYGVCFRTIRKILDSLVKDNVVRYVNKKHEFWSVSGKPFQQRVVFLSSKILIRPVSALNQGQNRIFDLLEYECLHHGLKLEIVEIDIYDSIAIRRAASDPALTAPALGYIIDMWWAIGEEARHSLFDLLARLALLKRPVAILDEIGDFSLPLPVSVNPLVQVFRIEGRKAGNRIGRMLLEMKHRSVVYLSSVHHASWSQQRLAGVVEEYNKAGLGLGVIPVVGEMAEVNHEYVLAISGFDESLLQRILAVNKTESEAEDNFKSFVQYKKTFLPGQFGPKDNQEIMERLEIIRNLAGRNIDKALFDMLSDDIFVGIAQHLNRRSRAPQFEQALTYDQATAWVCANDGMAMSALSFLRERAIAVPQTKSIVGFDNVPIQAIENRLTTFDFNARGFVHRMLNYLARPPKPRGPYHHIPIEVEGIVMQRDTTGQPGGDIKR